MALSITGADVGILWIDENIDGTAMKTLAAIKIN